MAGNGGNRRKKTGETICKPRDGEEISQQQPEQGNGKQARRTNIISTNANENRGQQHATWTTTAGGKDGGGGSNDGLFLDFSTNLDFPAITSFRIIFYKASIVQW
jgi:hypothetical protein